MSDECTVDSGQSGMALRRMNRRWFRVANHHPAVNKKFPFALSLSQGGGNFWLMTLSRYGSSGSPRTT